MKNEKEKWIDNFNNVGKDAFKNMMGASSLKGGQSFLFETKKARALFFYGIMTHKDVKLCDVDFLNSHPSKFDSHYLFPRDVYLMCYRNDTDKVYKAEADYFIYPFPKSFIEFYNKWSSLNYPFIKIIFCVDNEDKQRVSVSSSIADIMGNKFNLDDEGAKLINKLMPKGSIIVNRYSDDKEYNRIVDNILSDTYQYVKSMKD